MRAPRLDEVWRLVALLAAGCGGKIAPEEVGSTNPTPATSEADSCRHEVEVRGFDRTLTSADACSLAEGAPPCFAIYCQPARVDCPAICGDPAVTKCTLPDDFMKTFSRTRHPRDASAVCPDVDTDGVTLHCALTEVRGNRSNGCPVEGRRPAMLVESGSEAGSSVGSYFAECAWLEAASVLAFEDLADDLRLLGAPESLVARCLHAAQQEKDHARRVGELAARYGAKVPPVVTTERAASTVLDLARENETEGVVRETFGAAVATWRATRAADPAVRATLAGIARDEREHAELSSAIGAFLRTQLDAEERAAVDLVRTAAIAALRVDASAEADETVRRLAGAPSARESAALLDLLAREAWS